MNNSEINLLPGQNVLLSREKVLSQRITTAVVLVTVLTLVVFGVTFLTKQITARRAADLNATYKKGLDDFSAQQAKADGLWNLEEKAFGIREVKQTRGDLSSQAAALVDLVGNGVTMNRVTLTRGGHVSAILRATDISSFNLLLDNLAKPNRLGAFSNVVITGLNINQEQVVSLTLDSDYEYR